MEHSGSSREKRRYPRFELSLPIEFKVTNDRFAHGAMIVNASETGLLVQSPKSLPVGTKLNIAVLFSKGFELANFEVVAEVVWIKSHPLEGKEGYQMGLRFVHILEEDRQKLNHLLGEAY
jgi:c-di-GMP-binding flagellar brake protein YcgR